MTATTQHTPTPWSYTGGLSGLTDEYAIRARGCVVGTVIPASVAQANAAFIVTACNAHDELVAALERAEKELRILNVTQDGTQKDNTCAAILIDDIRAALAKAGV